MNNKINLFAAASMLVLLGVTLYANAQKVDYRNVTEEASVLPEKVEKQEGRQFSFRVHEVDDVLANLGHRRT